MPLFVANGVIVDVSLVAQDPHFELQGNLLMRMTKDKNTGTWQSQVLVPKQYHNQVLKLSHDVQWEGHLGLEKTQNMVLEKFFSGLGYTKK